MSEPRIAYTVRNDVNPDGEIGALTAVYSYIIKNHQTLRNTRGGERCRTVESSLSSGSDTQTTERKTRKK